MHVPLPPHPTKHNLQNNSNFQAVVHIQIIPGKRVTCLATEMRKMALKPVITFLLPTHLTPTHWNVHLLCVTQQIETELSLNEFLTRRRILRVANRLLGQLGSHKIVKLLVNGGL